MAAYDGSASFLRCRELEAEIAALRAGNADLKEKMRKARVTFGMIALSAKGTELELAQAGRALLSPQAAEPVEKDVKDAR